MLCKYNVNAILIAHSEFKLCFWELSENFFPNIFDLSVESTDVEATCKEGLSIILIFYYLDFSMFLISVYHSII